MLIALILMTAAATAPGDVVISEIMYNPDGQTLGEDDLYEWIELCNLLPDTVQLAGMMLSDGGNQLFLDGFELQPMARVVVAADGTSFTSAYGAEVPLVSWDGVWTKLALGIGCQISRP